MEMINQFPLLLYLSLAECGISDSYGRRIGDLCRHKRVKELNISGNELEEMSCILLSNGLSMSIEQDLLTKEFRFSSGKYQFDFIEFKLELDTKFCLTCSLSWI